MEGAISGTRILFQGATKIDLAQKIVPFVLNIRSTKGAERASSFKSHKLSHGHHTVVCCCPRRPRGFIPRFASNHEDFLLPQAFFLPPGSSFHERL